MRSWLAGASPAVRRIYADYQEMPGLRVTLAQARRLWSLDEAACREALDVLVAKGVLARSESGTYTSMTGDKKSQRLHRTPQMPLERLHARHWHGRRQS
jgi:hypothetical protein